jgi:preprotein translocase subunit SecF
MPAGNHHAEGAGPQDDTDLEGREHASSGGGTSATGRALHPYVQTGPRNQPKRPPKSKR